MLPPVVRIIGAASRVPGQRPLCLDPGRDGRRFSGATAGFGSSNSRSDGGRQQDAGEGSRLSSGDILVAAATATAASLTLGLSRGFPSTPTFGTPAAVSSASRATTAAASDASGGRGLGAPRGSGRSGRGRSLPSTAPSPVSFHFLFTTKLYCDRSNATVFKLSCKISFIRRCCVAIR